MEISKLLKHVGGIETFEVNFLCGTLKISNLISWAGCLLPAFLISVSVFPTQEININIEIFNIPQEINFEISIVYSNYELYLKKASCKI